MAPRSRLVVAGALVITFAALSVSAAAHDPPESACALEGAALPTREPDVWAVSARLSCPDDAGIATGRLIFRPGGEEHGAVQLDLMLDLDRGSLHAAADGPVSTIGLVSTAVTRGVLRGKSGTYLGYLAVWEQTITAIEDPELGEIALGGPVEVRPIRPRDKPD
jgi:hypothetical protein